VIRLMTITLWHFDAASGAVHLIIFTRPERLAYTAEVPQQAD